MEVYRLVLPIHVKRRDYYRQSQCYAKLNQLCEIIVKENMSSQRLFFNYYRVAFYGELFGNLNATEWVYKENSEIRLSDITERLTEQYGNRFGKGYSVIAADFFLAHLWIVGDFLRVYPVRTPVTINPKYIHKSIYLMT